jgi:hypothetical protein
VGELAECNNEEANAQKLIEQHTNFSCNSVPRGTRENIPQFGPATQAALSPKLIIDGTEP